MTAFRWLLLLFLSLIQSIIGIMVARRRNLPSVLGGTIGFLFIPIFLKLLPNIAGATSRNTNNSDK
ncbi:hypothetical protein [Geosporobacter ferrireducens]|uniref:Uncharacterized protein n=1 Tax=Geosporobacter ferrireducens TaxID=1424294 RepID=A0A1D8GNY7_9FIRM|nr:hypothetical protein [Geosporobacter ferrireducens]AOT72661.1 hypothetical protein Gferi_25760 [Geosporobacter ferrireducens]MTI55066.1 hypothetical protein [Geosporobacter ferrireducens]